MKPAWKVTSAAAALALIAVVLPSCGGGGDGITVTAHVATVVVSPSSASVAPNGSTQFTAATLDAQGAAISGQQITWSSSNTSVATVSASGFATGVSPGSATISATSDGKTGSASITVTAPSFSLTIAGTGAGSGTVTAPSAGGQGAINCTITAGAASGACSGSYPSGTVVSLTAAAAAGNTFGGWSGACSGASTSCQVTMSQAQSVTASFTPSSFTITTSSSPVAGGSTSGGGTFAPNASVTVVATPAAGYAFVNWTEGAAQVSTSTSYTFTVTATRSLVANFASGSFALSVLGSGTGNGTVTVPATGGQAAVTCAITAGAATGPCGANYPPGTVVTVTATPAQGGNTHTAWGGSCAGTAAGTACTLSMTAARPLTATFTAPAVDPCIPITLAFPGVANGTLSSASCAYGTFPIATQYPSNIYRFTANGATATAFAVASTFSTPTIEVMLDPPNGGNIVWGPASGVTAAVGMTYLLPSGSYQARVTSRPPGGNGTFTLTGTAPAISNGSCNLRTLLVSVTLSSQSLATTDCKWGTDGPATGISVDGTFFDVYAINSAKPCTISMSSATLDTYLEIWDSGTNTRIAYNDNFTGTNSQIGLTTCQGSTGSLIYIYANSNTTPVLTGSYTLTLTITGGGSVIDAIRPTTSISFPNAWTAGVRQAPPSMKKQRH